jgi:hypothetical protein
MFFKNTKKSKLMPVILPRGIFCGTIFENRSSSRRLYIATKHVSASEECGGASFSEEHDSRAL